MCDRKSTSSACKKTNAAENDHQASDGCRRSSGWSKRCCLDIFLDLNIIADRQEIYTSAFLTFTIGGILYLISLKNFKKQIVWIIFLILFFIAFQIAFLYLRHIIY